MCRLTDCPQAREGKTTDCSGCKYDEPEESGIDSLCGWVWSAVPAQE